MRIIGTVVVALMSCLGIANPVSSSLGARSTAIVENGSEVGIPYVTDGLVAMWDGIWNSGIEKHETKPEYIADLVGHNSLFLTWGAYGTGIVIGEDYFAINNIRGGKAANYDMTELKDAILDGNFTIDVCVRIDVKNGQLWMIDDNTRMYGASAYMSWLKVRGALTLIDTLYQTQGEKATLTCVGSNNGNIVYRDGVAFKNFGMGTQTVSDGIEIGYGTAGGWFFFCVRIYNRALSGEEVEYNHLIDRERFGF